ncbi:class I SAM-dependent methyltransferase [Bailinhaonella thermotolerans]|uniref:Class I SAM-dependent methyltransferase n=1 Tax=Bailinhaonella thermotolerans TaxID=1070861 RepID=A0A3A4ARC0_9ACTN|nr:class I SAM-dependent methyltransferase [Bailinhaonella thermotolerans]
METADQSGLAALGRRWREDLGRWGIPEEILAQAAESPWRHSPGRFARRAEKALARRGGPTHDRAREALPEGGTVLDVGAGAGAASLPLAPGLLIAVDTSAEMLAELTRKAAPLGVRVETVEGRWPDVAGETGAADVVVCAHVVYNVPDLPEFFAALSARARRRVVVELTPRHPMSWLNPLWKHFHDLERPVSPTAEDAAAIARALGHAVRVETAERAPDPGETLDDRAAQAARRLCLPPERAPEVARVVEALGMWPEPPSGTVTLWWDVQPDDASVPRGVPDEE